MVRRLYVLTKLLVALALASLLNAVLETGAVAFQHPLAILLLPSVLCARADHFIIVMPFVWRARVYEVEDGGSLRNTNGVRFRPAAEEYFAECKLEEERLERRSLREVCALLEFAVVPFKVLFRKRDGDMREMTAWYERMDGHGNFQVHDLVKNELRSIRPHTVQWVLLEGVKYVVE